MGLNGLCWGAMVDWFLCVIVCLQKKAAVVKGGKAQAKKKAASKFVIDCTTAETDSILDCANFVCSTSPLPSLKGPLLYFPSSHFLSSTRYHSIFHSD
jgi:hypothetical protein